MLVLEFENLTRQMEAILYFTQGDFVKSWELSRRHISQVGPGGHATLPEKIEAEASKGEGQ